MNTDPKDTQWFDRFRRNLAGAREQASYKSYRPCPEHGAPVERATASGQCRFCHRDAMAVTRRKRRVLEQLARRVKRRANARPVRGHEGLLLARQRARVARHRARRAGAVCTCCDSADILGKYLEAVEIGYRVWHKIPWHKGGKHCIRNMELVEPGYHLEGTDLL